ncbi:serine/threonine-protein kinase ATR-like isoform X2 [Biomphalaria glabrata]|uniref:Serine/threonine-protein kinase ATR n=1 Tax=Biomphalaria glabrata TaxID=6526 RepID=A0A9W2YRQ9_BIOGL|nr:serine/threonine-protein kinase ATR-like isoform X2 [Biomphalaria glabrata]
MSHETKSKVSKVEQPTIEFIERWKTADGVKDYSTQSYRRTIADLVDNYLTDLDEVAETLLASDEASGSLRFLTMCCEFLSENVNIFIQTSPESTHKSNQPLEEEIQSYAFCFWFFRCLLRLLSRPDCRKAHSVLIKLIILILHHTRLRSKHLFKQHLLEFIRMPAVLIDVSDQLNSGVNQVPVSCFEYDLLLARKSLKDTDCEFQDENLCEKVGQIDLLLCQADHCEMLQTNLVLIHQQLLHDLCLLEMPYCDLLWKCLCWNLHNGDVELKIVSLNLVSALIGHRSFPPLLHTDYLVACLVHMWELLALKDVPLNQSMKQELETSSIHLTLTLIAQERACDYPILPPTLYRQLCNITPVKSLPNLILLESKKTLISLYIYALRDLSSSDLTSLLVKPVLEQLVMDTVNLVGCDGSVDYVVPLLVHITIVDCQATFSFLSAVDTVSEYNPKKRRYSHQILSKSPSLRPLSFLLSRQKDVSTCQESPSCEELECLHVIIEVAATSLAHYKRKKIKDRFLSQYIFPENVLTISLDTWSRFLHSVGMLQSDLTSFSKTYIRILESIGSILLIHDTIQISVQQLHHLAWIVSLPWMANEVSWKDLKPNNPKDVAKIAGTLVDALDLECVCQCLKTLSLLPKDICVAWRAHVLTQAMTDQREEVTRSVIHFFPHILHNMGQKSNHLVRDLLIPILEQPKPKLHLEISQIFGSLILTMLEASKLIQQDSLNYSLQLDDLKITANDELTRSQLRDKGQYLDPSLITPFMVLLKSPVPDTRRYAVRNISHVLDVLDLQSSNALAIINSCLDLLTDEIEAVRKECCGLIHHMVIPEDRQHPGSASKLIWKKLESAIVAAHGQNNRALVETVLKTIGQFGKLEEGPFLEAVIICLLENRLNPHLPTGALAFEQLHQITSFKKETIQHIYTRFKPAIYKFAAEALYADELQTNGANSKMILITLASTLEADDLRSFLQNGEKYMLPLLLGRASPHVSKIVKLIASLLSNGNKRRSLLIDNMKYIFSYLVRSCQKEEMETALIYLQKETNFSLGSLLRLDFQRVHNELLLHLSTHYQQVFNGLRTLAAHDEQYKGPKNIETSEQMAQYLEPRLLGVLAFFDSQLMNSNTLKEDKILALKSVISIIGLMGSKHISSIRHKVMNTLKLGLQFTEKPFVEISCKAWNCFVRSLDLPLLGVMMSQIIAILLPLLQALPEQVSEIFNYIIVENKAALAEHFHEIYFLPDIPELTDSNTVLRELGESSACKKDLKSILAHSIKGIHHESFDVRVHALTKLRKLLKDKQLQLSSYILNSESADKIVSDLVSALLLGCREADPNTQCLYGQCLGELGAIDPGRLELITKSKEDKLNGFYANIDDDNFAFDLINVVVKAFLAAPEARIQDCAAFALQELLQIYKISSQGETQSPNLNSKLWKRFPEDIQEILIPLLTSKYKLTVDKKCASFPRPLYESEKGKNFKDWVSNWTSYLITQVKPGRASQVFMACSAAKRHSKQVALYILPHVVLHVLMEGNPESMDEILKEIDTVLHHVQGSAGGQESATNFHHLSAQTVFSVLDYLTMWCNHITASGHSGKEAGYDAVSTFLKRILQYTLALACINCKAYARSLRHFESFLTPNIDIQLHLDFMQRLFVLMDEPDGVLGVAAKRSSQPTLMQEILRFETLGQQFDSQACYERAIELEPNEISHHHGLLKSLMDFAQPYKVLIHSSGVLASRPRWTSELNSYCIEAAWKLGSWDKLEEALKVESGLNTNWPVMIGRILMASRQKHESEFVELLDVARKEQMGLLSAASMEVGSYLRGYENIVRLHMLNEIEEFLHVMEDFPAESDAKDVIIIPSSAQLLSQWQNRLQMAQSTFRTQEPILTLRRTLTSLTQKENHPGLDIQIGKWWLQSAKVARKAGYLQTAQSFLLQARSYNLPEFYLEEAKWLHEKGESVAAIACLDKGIQRHFGDINEAHKGKQLSLSLRQVYAQSLLLLGSYSEETSNLETNHIVKHYKDVIEICPDWEKGHFRLAKYYDRVMNTMIDDKDKAGNQGDFIIHVVKNFGMSLKYGNQHIYQSLPRLLSLWLDYGTAVVENETKDKLGKMAAKIQIQKTVLKRINEIILQLNQQLCPYQMFTAFSQLISRICHTQPDVFQTLEEIISHLLVVYPHQAMWLMMSVSKSSYPIRVKRCQDIFATAIQKDGSLSKLIQDCRKLTDRMLELCEKDFGNCATVNLNQLCKPLKRLFDNSSFSQILLPLQSSVTVNLPAAINRDAHHNPFPENLIYIRGFEDTIEILPSLQKPKKITLRGSDGNNYVMMCKPKDDLRKDCRLMEFNMVINRFLRRNAESRRRRLMIRTYAVTPLNEECGLIEWVNNTTGLRNILVKLYKEKGTFMAGKELRAVMPARNSSLEVKMKIYKETLLPRHPQVFPEWFVRTFPDPIFWYNARQSYARTAAVMSIVGYILGLGDRHGENILLDSKTGDCVHVDFNCLFNKGETFDWPEIVPFRLTPNMNAALGPLGYEGLFRVACEITLKVIRDQMEPLMCVLKPFIYDPLVEWSKSIKGQRSSASDSGEINNELALNHVQNIEDRMRGFLKTNARKRCLPLSIEGHVDTLIREATDEKNLCQMYIGWAAFL